MRNIIRPESLGLVLVTSLAASAGVGCTPEVEEPTADVSQSIVGCPSWGCGGNSPLIDIWEFHELDLDGAPNSTGISVLDLMQKGRVYRPLMDGTQLVGDSPDPRTYPSIKGYDLTGAYFEIQTPDGVYKIDIDKASHQTAYWVGPPDLVWTYELEYEPLMPGIAKQPLCHNPPDEGIVWPNALEAILSIGDRYDADTKEVTAIGAAAGHWVTVHCAGSATAKLLLNRYVEVGAMPGFETTQLERQALLKLYTSDACGTGEAFTEQGVPLHWQNAQGTVTLDGGEVAIEALWDEHGAICLDQHRLETNPNYPNIHTTIAKACDQAGHPLPACSDLQDFPKDWHGAMLMSALPKPQ